MIFKEADPRKLNINKHELSARMAAPCDLEDEIFAKLYDELLLIAKPAYVAVRVELAEQNGGISIGKFNSSSKALIKLCQGCSSCIAFVATLGIGVDRLIFKRAQIQQNRTHKQRHEDLCSWCSGNKHTVVLGVKSLDQEYEGLKTR